MHARLPQLLKTLGHDGMFLVALAAYVARAWGYTLLSRATVWLVLLLEVLHGVTFALMWSAATEFAKTRAPPGWDATLMSIVQGPV